MFPGERRILPIVLTAGMAFGTAACDRFPSATATLTPPTPGPTETFPQVELPSTYPLQKSDGILIDQNLGLNNEDPALQSVTFSFDPLIEGGSIVLKVCFKGDGAFRVISYEQSPRQGYLVDRSYVFADDPSLPDPECELKYPVIQLRSADVEDIYLGVGNTPEETYQNMRAYRITSLGGRRLKGEFLGAKTLTSQEIVENCRPDQAPCQ